MNCYAGTGWGSVASWSRSKPNTFGRVAAHDGVEVFLG